MLTKFTTFVHKSLSLLVSAHIYSIVFTRPPFSPSIFQSREFPKFYKITINKHRKPLALGIRNILPQRDPASYLAPPSFKPVQHLSQVTISSVACGCSFREWI